MDVGGDRHLPGAVVGRIHGYALGGGSGVAACLDIGIASEDGLRLLEVKPIIPAVISPFVLPRIGEAARRYFLTGERFDAETALRIGLVSEVTDDLDGAVERVVGELLTRPQAAREAKRSSAAPGRRRGCADRGEAPLKRGRPRGAQRVPRAAPAWMD